jgi:hypothetical protein
LQSARWATEAERKPDGTRAGKIRKADFLLKKVARFASQTPDRILLYPLHLLKTEPFGLASRKE